ncbi:hypothetical protein PVAND_007644 [Polypedilum vanderplanki]|uniref:carboxylesterase n=1 Tax=Polypedilum vanderplanki TaxID=319348 RepID=A0A9J6C7A9_POLVA|nr:hypothetical protein PVAND_007644 [Polypedilum vanderplanki]
MIKSVFLIFLIVRIAQTHIVEIENGKIIGAEYNDYYAYRGLRYAKAQRFRIAKPYEEKWNDTKEFFNYGHECAQYDHLTYTYVGQEDCLFLNVFLPKSVINSKEPVPVVAFLYGGAFMFGSSNYYHPEFFMNHGKMILVTLNYRLGILGFLSTEDNILPGNLGLKDQVEALKWVQRNIKAFNGDANKVTITGYSAGAASVHLHYLSPLSKNLFNNGISHSGVAFNPWVLVENSKEKAYKVAEYAECPFDDHKEMVKCLKKKPASSLVMLAKKFQPFLYNPFSPFGVVVEKPHKNAFLTDLPQKLLKNGNFNKRPWIVSMTKDEGNYPAAEFYGNLKTMNEIDTNWEKLAPSILDFDELTTDSEKKSEVSRIIREFYMHKMPISRENYQAFDDILSDRLFKHHSVVAIQLQSKWSSSYYYYFNYKSLMGVGEIMSKTNDNLGIAHGEDVFLIFKSGLRHLPYSDEELEMNKKLLNFYYDFAKSDTPKFAGLTIEQSTPDNCKYLQIFSNEKFSMKEIDENFGNVNFWDKMEKMLLHSNKKHNDEL